MTPDEAQKVIDEAKQERARLCAAEIDEVLKRYNCALSAAPIITADGRIGATVGITPQ